MEQKVIQIGNSVGIIIPKSLLDKLGLRAGSEVVLEPDSGSNYLTITKRGSKTAKSSITPEFIKVIERINKQYGPALRKLAEK